MRRGRKLAVVDYEFIDRQWIGTELEPAWGLELGHRVGAVSMGSSRVQTGPAASGWNWNIGLEQSTGSPRVQKEPATLGWDWNIEVKIRTSRGRLELELELNQPARLVPPGTEELGDRRSNQTEQSRTVPARNPREGWNWFRAVMSAP